MQNARYISEIHYSPGVMFAGQTVHKITARSHTEATKNCTQYRELGHKHEGKDFPTKTITRTVEW